MPAWRLSHHVVAVNYVSHGRRLKPLTTESQILAPIAIDRKAEVSRPVVGCTGGPVSQPAVDGLFVTRAHVGADPRVRPVVGRDVTRAHTQVRPYLSRARWPTDA